MGHLLHFATRNISVKTLSHLTWRPVKHPYSCSVAYAAPDGRAYVGLLGGQESRVYNMFSLGSAGDVATSNPSPSFRPPRQENTLPLTYI